MSSQTERSFSPYLPIFLMALALVTSFSFQTRDLINQAEQLKTAIGKQQTAVEESQKVRTQLAEMAKQALALANQGNKNAAILIESMRKKGVNIKASKTDPDQTSSENIQRD